MIIAIAGSFHRVFSRFNIESTLINTGTQYFISNFLMTEKLHSGTFNRYSTLSRCCRLTSNNIPGRKPWLNRIAQVPLSPLHSAGLYYP